MSSWGVSSSSTFPTERPFAFVAGFPTEYTLKRLVDLGLGRTAWAPSGTLYLAQYSSVVTTAGTGSEVAGVSRISRANDTNEWTPLGNARQNANAFTFPPAPSSYDLRSVALIDAPVDGNILWAFELENPYPVVAGDIVSIGTGALIAGP